jgi:hypothetical protein
VIDLVPSSSTLNASPPEVLSEPDSSFAVMVKEVATPAVMVATGVPIDFVASVVSDGGSDCQSRCDDTLAGSNEHLREHAG